MSKVSCYTGVVQFARHIAGGLPQRDPGHSGTVGVGVSLGPPRDGGVAKKRRIERRDASKAVRVLLSSIFGEDPGDRYDMTHMTRMTHVLLSYASCVMHSQVFINFAEFKSPKSVARLLTDKGEMKHP